MTQTHMTVSTDLLYYAAIILNNFRFFYSISVARIAQSVLQLVTGWTVLESNPSVFEFLVAAQTGP